jgi:fumarate hydratase subunit alpha
MPLRQLSAEKITRTVKRLCVQANILLGDDVIQALKQGYQRETSPSGRHVLQQILENARIAAEERIPLCQDTGLAVVFVEMGQDLHVIDGDLNDSIHEGVRQGYREGYLRASSLDPLTRKNSGDNTPAIVHVTVVPGDRMRLTVAPKKFGSENMSRVVLFAPAAGIQRVRNFVL